MTIRSFVLRQGRMTVGQERAYETLWPAFGISINETTGILNPTALYPTNAQQQWVLEIGFGNGESLIQMAKNAPNTAFLGIEVHGPGVGHALLGIEKNELTNLRLIRHDAVQVLRNHIADNSLDRIQIYFPDPWQKLRHHKRRLVQKPFTDLLHQKLKIGGELHCATDWENYAEWMVDIFRADPKWHNLGNTQHYAERPEWRPQTKFERRGINKGHGVWDIRHTAIK